MVSLLSLKSFTANNINSFHILICIGGAISCLLPLYFQESYIEESRLSESLKSIEFTIFCTICFTLATPLILEQIIESIASACSDSNGVSTRISIKILFLTDMEKLFFIFGVLIVPIVTVIPGLQNLAFTYICCLRAQLMLTIGIVTAAYCRYDKGFWPRTIITISILLLTVGLVTAAFATNLYENKPVTRLVYITWNYCYLVILLAAVLLLCVCLHHLIKIFSHNKIIITSYFKNLISMRANKVVRKGSTKEDIFVGTYIAMIFSTFVFILVVYSINPELVNLGSISLIFASLPFGCFILFLSVLLMRIAKAEMTEAVVSFEIYFYV